MPSWKAVREFLNGLCILQFREYLLLSFGADYLVNPSLAFGMMAQVDWTRETIEEAQLKATEWLWTYNNDRPNMAISGGYTRY